MGGHRPQSRTGNPHVEPVDEKGVQRDVDPETADSDYQRGARILQTPQKARRRNDDEHKGKTPPRNREIRDRTRHHLGSRADELYDTFQKRQTRREQHRGGDKSQPHAVETGRNGASGVTATQPARHPRGRGVGQEDHEPQNGLDDSTGDGQAAQSISTQVAHHRGVSQKKNRFRGQRTERRQGQPDDFAVKRDRRL